MFKFKLTLTKVSDEPEWSDALYRCTDDFYHLDITGNDPKQVVEYVKGAILVAISNRRFVPNHIEFEVNNKTNEEL